MSETNGFGLSQMRQNMFRRINIYFCSRAPLHDSRYNCPMSLKSYKQVIPLLWRVLWFPEWTHVAVTVKINFNRHLACNFTKNNTLYGCFSRYLNCANGREWRKISEMYLCLRLNATYADTHSKFNVYITLCQIAWVA